MADFIFLDGVRLFLLVCMNNSKKNREREITKTSVVGIVTNFLLALFKAVVGLLANSIAVVLDAVNNLSDALSSVITIIGIKFAHRKPDKKHPFGYGRVEYFSGILIAGLVFSAGVVSFVEAVKKIFNPEVPDYQAVTLVVISVAIVTKILLGRYVKRQGEKFCSDALIASGSDASFDAIISASTLLGALISIVGGISVDGWIGAIISAFIIKAGVELLGQPVSHVVGARANSETTRGIKADIRSVEGVIGAYDLVLHNYGPDYAVGSVHVEVDDSLSARDIHVLTKKIQLLIKEKYDVFLSVGIYAVDMRDDSWGQMQKSIKSIVNGFDGVIQSHGIFIDADSKYISLDAVVDFKVDDKALLRQRIVDGILSSFHGYQVDVNFDIDYSD